MRENAGSSKSTSTAQQQYQSPNTISANHKTASFRRVEEVHDIINAPDNYFIFER